MFSSYYRCYFDKYFNISSNSTNPDRWPQDKMLSLQLSCIDYFDDYHLQGQLRDEHCDQLGVGRRGRPQPGLRGLDVLGQPGLDPGLAQHRRADLGIQPPPGIH